MSAREMYVLFNANRRLHGVMAKTGKVHAVYEEYTEEKWESHLCGDIGIGLSPIQDDDLCTWGALDIDNHNNEAFLGIAAIAEAISVHHLPLLLCRSKSGGAHCYLFLKTPVRAPVIRKVLGNYAKIIGVPTAEVFPKQDTLKEKDGSLCNGSWLNMPYYGDSSRVFVHKGKDRDCAYFLEHAHAMLQDPAMIQKTVSAHDDAPPCIQKMIANGVPHGQRNNAMFQFCVYLKQRYPDTWRDEASTLNLQSFAAPLKTSELTTICKSIEKRDYRYKCKLETFKELCNPELCCKMKYGITPAEFSEGQTSQLPIFSNIRKHLTEPVRWEIDVDGRSVMINTEDLLSWTKLRIAIAENLTVLLPNIKAQDWQKILHPLINDATILDAPNEISMSELCYGRMLDYLKRADLDSEGINMQDRSLLARGYPVVQQYQNERWVFFRAEGFKTYLQKTRADAIDFADMWMVLRGKGVKNIRIRAEGRAIGVWAYPADKIPQENYEMEINNEQYM